MWNIIVYNMTFDKLPASMSCAILGSQHNWGFGAKGNSVIIYLKTPNSVEPGAASCRLEIKLKLCLPNNR